MFCISPPQGGLSSVVYVKVDLVDINDNRPTFYPLSYAVSLSTQSAPGTSVVRVMAYDPDTGENGRVTYRTAPGGASPYFTLNKDTGWFNHMFFPPIIQDHCTLITTTYNVVRIGCKRHWVAKTMDVSKLKPKLKVPPWALHQSACIFVMLHQLQHLSTDINHGHWHAY